MTKTEALEILTAANKWRRGADIPQPDPKEFGEAIDIAITQLRVIVISEEELYGKGNHKCG